jgi:hypothetical protein
MKFILSSIVALAISGVPLPLQEPDDKGKPQQEEPKKKPPEPRGKQQPEEKPKAKPEKPPKQEPQQPDEKQREKQQKEQEKQQKQQAKTERRDGQPEHPQTARPGDQKPAPAKGRQIPPEKFRASFGREHHFRVTRSGGDDRRFRYGGYWFEVVEVWPAGWDFDDDCYIDEDGDDYYLVDVIHPELRVLVIVVSG